MSEEIAHYHVTVLSAFAYELHEYKEISSQMPLPKKKKIVRSIILSWLEHERHQKTSSKSELARKLMKLHDMFEGHQTTKLPQQLKFNELARRLDIQGRLLPLPCHHLLI